MTNPSDPLKIVAEFDNVLKAHSVRILLEANGIPAVVFGEAISETGLEPIHVCVHQSNLKLAKTVILEVPAASEIMIPEWTCGCGEQVDAGFHVCWSCGGEHGPIED